MLKGNKLDFPLLCQQDIVYLDSAATAQRPFTVMDAERKFYENYNANPLRGFYDLAVKATDKYEDAREKVRAFINADSTQEIIFTRNTTESINLVAYSYGLKNLHNGDEILITISEHHSNMLPWQMVAAKTGAKLKFLDCEPDGSYTDEAIKAAVNKNTKIAAVTHISNVLGMVTPVEKIINEVHKVGGRVLIDGAQSTPHRPIDVKKLDADFFAFSGHKMMAPMGIGVLYGKKEILNEMPPFLSGGEMIESVTREGAVYAGLPHKFEAGTVNAAGAVGLAAAIDYINKVGFENIEIREKMLTEYAFNELSEIPHINILGGKKAQQHNGIFSFTIDNVHPHDIAAILNEDKIAIRAGHHCAQPLLRHLGVFSTVRASISFYNTEEDIQKLVKSVKSIRRKMGFGE